MSDDQDLADAILAMAKLSPGERATVISVVDRMRFTVAEATVKPIAEPNQKRTPRPHYTPQERTRLRFYATNWQSLTEAKQQAALSSFDNRTESQVYRMIHKYRTGK